MQTKTNLKQLRKQLQENYNKNQIIKDRTISQIMEQEPVQVFSFDMLDNYYPVSVSAIHNHYTDLYTFTISYPEHPAFNKPTRPEHANWIQIILQDYKTDFYTAIKIQQLIFLIWTNDHQ